jgi:hypothetical protein
MTRGQIRVLLAACIWTLYVWITRVFILAGQDTSTGFKVVHFALAGISIVFGLAVGWVGLSARRARRDAP